MERTVARSFATLVVAAAAASVIAAAAGAAMTLALRGADDAHPGSVAHIDAMQVGPVHPLLPGLLPPLGTLPVSDLTPSSATPPPTLDAIKRELRELVAPTSSVRDVSYVGPVHPIVPAAVGCVDGVGGSAPVARCASALPTVDPAEATAVDEAARAADQLLQGDARPPVH